MEKTCSTTRCPGSGRHSKQTEQVNEVVDSAICTHDWTTEEQLHEQLISQGISLSKSPILRCRQSLGWRVKGNAYSQMIHEVNQVKYLEWATKLSIRCPTKKGFLDVIFTDKT